MDLGAVAHLSTIKGRVPFLHFFDGFRTSHEIQKIETWDQEDLKDMLDMDAAQAFRDRALNPEHPILKGTAQNPDIFFQAREACNKYYDAIPEIVEDYMNQVNAKIGTNYKLFNYYGAEDAEQVIIAMGSVNDTIEETIDYLNAQGQKLGLIKVRLYRPFRADKLVEAIPTTVKKITVLDRTKEPGSLGEPLYLDVVAALKGTQFETTPVFTGRYGLGSKDTTPAQIKAVFENTAKQRFTIGIVDDVTNLSLDEGEALDSAPEGTTACKFWGLGADGTVGANKNSIKIIGDHTDMYAQAYFAYDSKKSGGVTVSHLRFGHTPIKSTYLINRADFVACHNQSYISKYDMVSDIKPNGTFLLNCQWKTVEELDKHLPGQVKRYLAQNNINFYTIDGVDLGIKTGMGTRINTILQSAFFKLANIIPFEDALQYMKDAAKNSYLKKGEDVVKKNWDAIDAGYQNIVKVEIPAEWANAEDTKMGMDKAVGDNKKLIDFVNNIQQPCNAQAGDKLPVSTFVDMADGAFPQGSAAYEKRGIAVNVPNWISEKCVQCNNCAYVCPHAVIRPFALTDEEVANAPSQTVAVDFKPKAIDGMKYSMGVSVLDCTGCGVCANVCPAKALEMKSLDSQLDQQEVFDYEVKTSDKPEIVEKFKETTVKGSQFLQPMLEFSGACAGCGETPYAKLVTQLFGDRMYISNATGCSSIWGGSAPSTPYTTNKAGKGPAWANSLFEDNAEHGYGMFLAQSVLRNRAINKVKALYEVAEKEEVKAIIKNYLDTVDDAKANAVATEKLVKAIEDCGCCRPEGKEVLACKDYLSKKSMWIFGGDGWAYDIGFGGLDHVIASGENVNIFVFDTEVYSNTGGQASKSTPTGAIAQFAAAGKVVKKKDLAGIAMSYGYVYVAHIAMGANPAQCLKAIQEAEAYDGPSLIIAYAPCINHGIKTGMATAQAEEKKAVEAGYWHLYRYNPALKLEGKNPFSLDSKAPKVDEKYKEFLMGEVRYNSLARSNPERAEKLFNQAVENAKERYDYLQRLVTLYGTNEE
jgi:pyruvate-ferredoxin/flavodoxin oxidoreductase